MLPAANRGAGQNIGFPDVCLTPAPPAPPVPIPYPNIAMNAQAEGYSQVVKVSGVNALTVGSTISMTSGDEAGASHPTVKGTGMYTTGNPIVSIDGLPAIHLACPTTGNKMNNPVGLVAVPSAVNVTYCLATNSEKPLGSKLDLDELTALADAMRSSSLRADLLPEGVALVTIPIFAAGVATDLARALRDLGDVRALLIDLRGCPGGDLDASLALAASFLDEGAEVARLHEADDHVQVITSAAPRRFDHPVAILIDHRTASAAEAFAASLRSNDRAQLIGRRTYGKRAAQRLVTTAEATSRVDVAAWSVASDRSARGPVEPDVELPLIRDASDRERWERTAWALLLQRMGRI